MINQLNPEEIEQVLKNNLLGRIGCRDDSKIYVVPVNYVYDGNYILAHSQPGLKIRMMRNHPDICFQVDEIKSFTNWKSVICWGTYQELAQERERYYAIRCFSENRIYVKLNESTLLRENVSPVFFRIVIGKKTGKYENT